MGTTINYRLSDDAQRAEIAAGRNGNKARTVDVDLSPLVGDKQHIMVAEDGNIILSLYRRDNNVLKAPQSGVLTPETALEAIKQEIIVADSEYERAVDAALAERPAAWGAPEYDRPAKWEPRLPTGCFELRYHPRIKARLEELNSKRNEDTKKLQAEIAAQKPELDALEAAIAAYENGGEQPKNDNALYRFADRERAFELEKRLIGRNREVENEKKQAEEEQRRQELAAVVERLGSPTQKEKWAAGLMRRSEALALLAAEKFQPLTEAGIAWKIRDVDVKGKSTLTDEQFLVLKQVKALIEAEVKPIVYKQWDDSCDFEKTMDGLLVTKTIGSLTLEAIVPLEIE